MENGRDIFLMDGQEYEAEEEQENNTNDDDVVLISSGHESSKDHVLVAHLPVTDFQWDHLAINEGDSLIVPCTFEYVSPLDLPSLGYCIRDEASSVLEHSIDSHEQMYSFKEEYALQPSATAEYHVYDTVASEEPTSDTVYVNSKQYHRIMKRREARRKLMEEGRIVPRKKYLYGSRHYLACKRGRRSDGRFEGKDENESGKEKV